VRVTGRPLRVAYTLEQCWHPVPGGSAVAANQIARRLIAAGEVELVGVGGRHRHPPDPAFEPAVGVHQLMIGRPLLYETWNRLEWPRVERATGYVDVCHSTIAIPAATAAPHVVTVHDIAFVHTPERFTRHGERVMRAGLERCRRADLVLCPSQATVDDLVGFGFDAGRLRLVPWGVEPVPVTSADLDRVKVAYDLPDRFVLFVGTLEPRKNLRRLAQATSRLDDRMPLVVAGAEGWGEAGTGTLDAQFLGFVADADLPALYSLATVFTYPSLQEGFGMPILEAMAYGVPVVTSRGSATDEVADGAAVLVDPTNIDSIAAGIDAAATDAALWIELGRARAARSTWDEAAKLTVEAYREVAR
jgi:glycosyltransferase involved in cell wall biosynthesis